MPTTQKNTQEARPTDPRAVVALQQWVEKNHPYMLDGTLGFVVDPCANFGGVLELMCDLENRYAIEIDDRYTQRLMDRVMVESLVIGSSLDQKSWPSEVGFIVIDLPTSGKSAIDFLSNVMDVRKRHWYGAGAAVLCLTTFTRAIKTVSLLKNCPPNYCLGMSFRLMTSEATSNTGQSHDWLVWLPEPYMGKPTIYECLSKPDVPKSVVDEFKVLSCP